MGKMKIRLNNKSVIFVRKDKTLFENDYKTVKEHKTGFVYLDDTQGVSVMPYKFDRNGKMEVLIREEPNPMHNSILTIISGKRDDHEVGKDWWKETAQRELGEESGYWVDNKNSFSSLGEVVAGKDYKEKDVFTCVDLTQVKQGKMKPDKGMIEKNSKNFWVSIDLLKRMFVESGNNTDSYFLALAVKFMSFMGLLDKSEETDLMKAVETKKATGSKRGPSKAKGTQKPVHKYIRREGQPGEYRYIYTEPEGKKGEKDDGKPKGIMAQLVEALGKKTGEKKEKAAPKIKPLEEYSRIKEPVPDFTKGTTAEQWLGSLDTNVIQTLISATTKNNTIIGSINSLMDRSYVFTLRDNTDAYPSAYSDINVEDKKLSDRAKILVQKAISKASQSYSIMEYHNAIMNSSMVEHVFVELGESFAKFDEQENTLKDQYKDLLRGIASPVLNMLNVLNISNDLIQEIKPLAKTDPKIDFMLDQIYESVDSLMKSRDRYIEDAVVFFINQIEPKLNNLDDWYSFKSAISLLDGFQDFNELVITSSTISAVNLSFANQWNLKQKGIYDGVSKYISNSIGKVVDNYRKVEAIQGSGVLDDIGTDFIERNVFNFLNLTHDQKRRFAINEQAFSYIDHFGLDRYYKDIVYISGIYDRLQDVIPSKKRIAGALERVAYAYEASDNSYKNMLDAASYAQPNRFRTSADGIVNTMTLLNPKANESSKIDSFIAVWSNASHGSLMTNAIEEMVNSKGVDRETYVNYHLASNRTILSRRPETKKALSDVVDVIYNDTQKIISKDYDDTVQLFRGNGSHESKSVASSWTWKAEEAIKFGEHVTEAEVPKEAILLYASPRHHADAWEYQDEGEFVVVPGLLPSSQKIRTKPADVVDMNRVQKEQDKKMDEMADMMDYADTHGDSAAVEKFGDTY